MATNRNFRINAGIQVGTTANVVGMMTSNTYLSNKTDVLSTPDFCFDFTKGMIDSRVQTIRVSQASFVNSSLKIQITPPNTPRVEFDLTSGQCMGLVCENQATNYVGFSDIEGPLGTTPRGMASAGNPSTVVTVSSDVWIGPNKTSAKHVYDGSGGNDNNNGYFTGALVSGMNVNASISFSTYVYIPSNSAITNCYMSLDSTTMTFTAYSVQANLSIRDKWQRMSGTTFVTGNTGGAVPVLRLSPIGAYVYSDCWQLEYNEYCSTWIPTTNVTSAFRNEDINYVPYSAISSTPNPSRFTMCAEVVPKWTANSVTANSINSNYATTGGGVNYGVGTVGICGLTWRLTYPPTSSGGIAYNGYGINLTGGPTYDIGYTSRALANSTPGFSASGNILSGGPANTGYNYPGATMVANTPIKVVWAMNSVSGDAFVVNGNSSVLSTSASTYNGGYVDILTFGYQYAGGIPSLVLGGNVKKLSYFHKSLSNNELIALTET